MTQNKYDEIYGRWQDTPESFWAEQAEAIHWYKKWEKVLDASRPPFYRWFTGGMVNTCYNALDRHVEQGRGNQPASNLRQPRHWNDQDLQLSRVAG